MSSLIIGIQRVIDRFFFSPLDYCLGFFKINKILLKEDVKRILVIKFWALGDSVVLLPLLDALKKEFPKAKIDILAHKRNRIVFEGQKNVNKIIEFGFFNIMKNFRKYDLCIDAEPALSVSATVAFLMSKYRLGFSHGIRKNTYQKTIEFKKQHMVQNYLDFARKIGIKYNTSELVPLAIEENDKKAVSEFLKKQKLTNGKIIGISPGLAESVKYRMWPVEKFAKLADELSEKGFKIIYIDSKNNIPTVKRIQSLTKCPSTSAAGLFDVKKSAELISRCKIVVANDSGLMHISASMGTKTIGLFGPNTPEIWAPYGKQNISIFKPKHGCPYMDNKKRELLPKKLTKEQLTCMDAISVNDVLNAVNKLLRK